MGLLSFLFPKPADRVAKARRLMDEERYAEARTEVLDIDLEEAREIRAAAERELVKANLERALHWARAGNFSQVDSHLDLARSLDDGSQDEVFREALSSVEALMDAHRAQVTWEELEHACLERRKMGGDPGDFTTIAYEGLGAIRLFFSQGRAFGLPGLELEPLSTWFNPDWLTAFVDPARPSESELVALEAEIGKRYPGIDAADLGMVVRSVAYMAVRKPEEAGLLLLGESDKGAVAYYELGRAAMALGEHEAASQAFAAALEKGISGEVDGLPVELLPAVNHVWNDSVDDGYESLRHVESSDAHVLKLQVAMAVEAEALEVARALLPRVAESDESYLQLEGALRLQETLQAQLELHPCLNEEPGEDREAFETAQESTREVLQAELDAVIEGMKALESEMDDEVSSDQGEAVEASEEQGDETRGNPDSAPL